MQVHFLESAVTDKPEPAPGSRSPSAIFTQALSEGDAAHSEHRHASAVDGSACRNETSNGVIDCEACISEQTVTLLNNLEPKERHLTSNILSVVRRSGVKGICKAQLLVSAMHGRCYSGD